MTANASDRSGAAPWDFKPLSGTALIAGYLAVVPLLLAVFGTVMIAVAFPFVALSRPAGEATPFLKSLLLFALWLAFVALAFIAIWGFRSLYRKLYLTALCPPGGVYLLRGSLLRSFSGVGRVAFTNDAMHMKGKLGPNMLWPLIVIPATILLLDILSVVLVYAGVWEGCMVVGVLGVVFLLYVYHSVLQHVTTITVRPTHVGEVRCTGPIVRVRFALAPVGSLRGVTLVVPPDVAKGFFSEFHRLFPGKLPQTYSTALAKT